MDLQPIGKKYDALYITSYNKNSIHGAKLGFYILGSKVSIGTPS